MIIGLAGRAGVGKDTVCEILGRRFDTRGIAFADPIRLMLKPLLLAVGASLDYMHDRALKEQPIPGIGLSYRVLAQTLGTEWGRTHGEDFWVRIAAARVQPGGVTVISDVRFPNEAEWIRSTGGVVWRIDRHVDAVAAHISESSVDQIRPDAVIGNNGSMADLLINVEAAWAASGLSVQA